MADSYCEICGNARIIRLPRRRRLTIGPGEMTLDDLQIENVTYPCPECSPRAPEDRVHLVEASVEVSAEKYRMLKGDAKYIEVVKRYAAETLAYKLIADGYMLWERGPNRPMDGMSPERVVFWATVAVAKKADAMSIAGRIRRGVEQAIASLAQRAADICKHDMMHRQMIRPSFDVINEAAAQVRAELERKDAS